MYRPHIKLICSVYIKEEDLQMLEDLQKHLETYEKVPRTAVFLMALREMHKKYITEKDNEENKTGKSRKSHHGISQRRRGCDD